MSFFIIIFKHTFWQAFLNILYFPIWWYTIGVKKRVLEFIKGTVQLSHNLTLKLMLTHLFKPMFGESSWKGRIISFFMRLILLIWRFFRFLLGTSLRFLILILWFVLPVLSLWQIISLIK